MCFEAVRVIALTSRRLPSLLRFRRAGERERGRRPGRDDDHPGSRGQHGAGADSSE